MSSKTSTNGDTRPACRACQRCPFCQVSAAEWEQIESVTPIVHYRAGITLFREGDDPVGVHLICDGQVKQWCSDEQGRRFLWRYVKTGEALGAITLLAGKPYPTTAETAVPCWVRFIRKGSSFQLLKQHQRIEHCLLLQVGETLYDTVQLLRTFACSRSAVERLAWLLYRLWVTRRGSGTGMSPVRIYLSRAEIAERIGVETPETVSRLLRQLVRRGLIRRDRGVTTVLEPDRLKSFSGGES